MSYERFYPGGYKAGASGGTPITPEALNHLEDGIMQVTSAQESIQKKIGYVTVVLRPEWWSGSAPYTYTIQVPGITEDWVPGIPWHNWWEGLTNEDLTHRLEEMGKIKLIRSGNGSLTFTAPDEKPDCALDLCVPGEVYSGTTKSDYS